VKEFEILKRNFMLHFDEHLSSRLREAGAPLLPFWRFLASYGMWGFLVFGVVLIMLGIGNPIGWLVLCIPVVLTQGLTLGLQFVIRRPRPPIATAKIDMWVRTYSFPSAHSAGSMAFALMFSSVLILQVEYGVLLSVFLLVFALLIGTSRIMVGVHYLGDVLAGFIFGILVSGIFFSVV